MGNYNDLTIEPDIDVEVRYYANGQCNWQDRRGAYSFLRIDSGSVEDVKSGIINNTTSPRCQIIAILMAADDAPCDEPVIIYSNDRYAVYSLTNETSCDSNMDLIEKFKQIKLGKQIYIVLRKNQVNDGLVHAVQEKGRELLRQGTLAEDNDINKRRMTKKEYAFVKGLEKLLIDFNVTMGETTFESTDIHIKLPRCNGRSLFNQININP